MKSLFRFLFSVRTIVVTLVVLAVVGGGGYLWWVSTAGAGGPGFKTDKVVRQNLYATISATGTLEPQDQAIDVGTQVAGLITKFGPADPSKPDGPVVDYCSVVKAGQVLAYIDPTIYQAQVSQATAVLNVAKANLAKSKANAAGLLDAYNRDRNSPGAVNEQQVVADKAAYDVAAADCTLQQASIDQATANLKLAQTNLDYCTIKAPPDSPSYTIIDRRVSIGQTVVSSLSAPSLFLLAKDLSRMQVQASVNEADIGNIHLGEDVDFTVDARPGKTFTGTVSQVRLNASMTQNVVTYTVVVNTTNQMINVPSQTHPKPPGNTARGSSQRSSKPAPAPDPMPDSTPAPAASDDKTSSEGVQSTTAPPPQLQEWELLPYLTANLTFHVANRENALLVPNAALRWRPQLQQVEPKYQEEYAASLKRQGAKDSGAGAPPATPKTGTDSGGAAAAPAPGTASTDANAAKPQHSSGGAASRGMVWVQVPNSNLVRPIKLVTGLTDGAMTEVVSVVTTGVHEGDTLDAGAEVITGENTGKAASATTNPFAPKLPFGNQQKKPDDQQQQK